MGTGAGQARFSPRVLLEPASGPRGIGAPSCTGSSYSYAMIDAIATCSISLHPQASDTTRHNWDRLTSRINNGVHKTTLGSLQ